MPCYSPLEGYRARSVGTSGKRGIVFNPKDGFIDRPVTVPCGQCVGCRLERSRQWAMRCVHEASLYEENCFITLTYNTDHLPESLGLDKTHFQKFMKRLRKRYPGKQIRYFHCGEYGERNYRPHYHACIFNHDFSDKTLFTVANNNRLYTSDILGSLWPMGFSTIGDVTFESAAYVARYIMKKVKNSKYSPEEFKKAYERVDPVTGEIFNVEPEYTTMSRRPGIGRGWFNKYAQDTYKDDTVIMRGKQMQPPKYYDGCYNDIDKIKKQRRQNARRFEKNNTRERLEVREKCKKAQISSLKRSLDED